MLFILLSILAIISLIGVRFSSFHSDYMSTDQTTAIKGIFAVLILLSHMSGYVQWNTVPDALGYRMIQLIGQLMVTMFFFYSGYGIFVSWSRKKDYVVTFFKQRFLKVLVHFDVALLLFVVLDLVLKIPQTQENWLLCWIGWGSIGNSNWFVFDTLVFYLIALASMLLVKRVQNKQYLFCIIISIFSIIFWGLMYKIRRSEIWWYNTVLCFPAGVWYGCLQIKIDVFISKSLGWVVGMACVGAAFVALYLHGHIVAYTLCAVAFCVVVVWLNVKVKIQNSVLIWMGKQSFSIYILQRIPMIILQRFGVSTSPFLFAILAVISVLLLSTGFTLLLDRLDRWLFSKNIKRRTDLV